MTRASRRSCRARAALQGLVVALHVARAAAEAQAPSAPRPTPAWPAAVNWASNAAYGATAFASGSGYWVRPARRERVGAVPRPHWRSWITRFC